MKAEYWSILSCLTYKDMNCRGTFICEYVCKTSAASVEVPAVQMKASIRQYKLGQSDSKNKTSEA